MSPKVQEECFHFEKVDTEGTYTSLESTATFPKAHRLHSSTPPSTLPINAVPSPLLQSTTEGTDFAPEPVRKKTVVLLLALIDP